MADSGKKQKEQPKEQPKDKQSEQQFAIQRIYVKDFSFEAPSTPNIFQQEWKPEMHLDIRTESRNMQENLHEVVLNLTVSVKNDNKDAFVAEVKHAGIFTIKGFENEQLHQTLGSFCPSVIYPYAREVISDAVARGGFPQLILAPVNFEALYMQHKTQQEAQDSKDQ